MSKAIFSLKELIQISLLYVSLVSLTIVGFLASVVIGRQSFLISSLAIVAYIFGLRHGLDADHIAAIDNTIRKLMQEGKKPLSVGTWFSLGHSTIVFALVVVLILSSRSIVDHIPSLQSEGAVLGSAVSGVFLAAIGLINVTIAIELYRIFKSVSTSSSSTLSSTLEIDRILNKRGFMNRYFGWFSRLIKHPWQMYPVGILFGLGFDTASEIALIAISVGVGVTSSVPLWMVLILPLMFTLGMVLVDTSDGIAMRLTYGWAFLKPIRKIYYNLTITIISVLVAFFIGGVELLQVLARELNLMSGIWSVVLNLDFETIGYLIVGVFILVWMLSVTFYRYRKFDKFDA